MGRTIRARGTGVCGSWDRSETTRNKKTIREQYKEQGKLYTDPQGWGIESQGSVFELGVGHILDLGLVHRGLTLV